jgi:hypothetical protein
VSRREIVEHYQIGRNKKVQGIFNRKALSKLLREKFSALYALKKDKFKCHVHHAVHDYTNFNFLCNKHNRTVGFKIKIEDIEQENENLDIYVWACSTNGLCDCLYSGKIYLIFKNFILF